MIFEELCLEQADIIEKLVTQNRKVLQELAQFTDVSEEEQRLEKLERRINGDANLTEGKCL